MTEKQAEIERNDAEWRLQAIRVQEQEEVFAEIERQHERMKAEMIATLNRDLFADGCAPVKRRPQPWQRRVYLRVSAYCSTLWRALKGEEPYDDY